MHIPSIPKAPVKPSDLSPEQLSHNKNLSEAQKIKELSSQFEAVLIRQILTESQKSKLGPGLGGQGQEGPNSIYQDMMTAQLADGMSRSGSIGLAQALQKQLTSQLGHNKPVPQPPVQHVENISRSKI